MIDSLVRLLPLAQKPSLPGAKGPYVLVTLHRPSNVDDPSRLRLLFQILTELSRQVSVIFPVHPRTRARLADLGLSPDGSGLQLVEPLGYLEFIALQRDAKVVVTDSGGVQEETTYLGVPCITVRPNTERPVTVEVGTNVLAGDDLGSVLAAIKAALTGRAKRGSVPAFWDGQAGTRLAQHVVTFL